MIQNNNNNNNSLEISSKTELQYSSSNYMELLCKNTDEINKPNECGWTPLYRTIISGNNEATKELLDKGADPNLGETALYQAVEMESKLQIDTLLSKGANPNIAIEDGTTSLHSAVIKGNLGIIKALLDNGAFPNSKTKFYLQTPLHVALKAKPDVEVIKILLKYNASTTMMDKFGKRPIDYVNEDNTEIRNLLSEAESSQLMKVSEVSESNLCSLEKDKESNKERDSKLILVSNHQSLNDIISDITHSENNEVVNGSERKIRAKDKEEDNNDKGNEAVYKYIDTIQSPNKDNKDQHHMNVNELLSANGNDNDNDNDIDEHYNEDNEANEEQNCLNDSLEGDYTNNIYQSQNQQSDQKKLHHISDFPLSSSMKRQHAEEEQEQDSIYKKIILAKRLNFNANSKLSYHKKNSNEPTSRDDYNTNQPQPSQLNFNTGSLIDYSQKKLNDKSSGTRNNNNNNNNTIDKSIASNDNGQLTSNLNKTSDNELNSKRINNTNCYSSFSTQPHSANPNTNTCTNSLKAKQQQYLEDNNQMLYQYPDNDQYGKVSEFTIKNVTTRQASSLQITKMKKWLNSIDLIEYISFFIDNEMCDIDRLRQVMLNYDTKLKYSDFEHIGIKKPGHIYRILTKLDIDTHSIDDKIVQFILPSHYSSSNSHNRNNSIETKFNLKISEEYCCGCRNFITKKTKVDLGMFLRKKTLQHLQPNFAHNGFDWLEYVLLQMFTNDYVFNEQILEDSMHIYNEEDRGKLLKCLNDEMKKINLFVNSKEYMSNAQKYRYATIDLEKEEQDKEKSCTSCVIY